MSFSCRDWPSPSCEGPSKSFFYHTPVRISPKSNTTPTGLSSIRTEKKIREEARREGEKRRGEGGGRRSSYHPPQSLRLGRPLNVTTSLLMQRIQMHIWWFQQWLMRGGLWCWSIGPPELTSSVVLNHQCWAQFGYFSRLYVMCMF